MPMIVKVSALDKGTGKRLISQLQLQLTYDEEIEKAVKKQKSLQKDKRTEKKLKNNAIK